MRIGFTTGSCAAAATKAAIYMLLIGGEKNKIKITTPKGIDYKTDILDIKKENDAVSCGVRKDGGDDPDVTSGSIIYSKVKILEYESSLNKPKIIIDGGEGVGRVTKPGLDQPIGNAAINHVPRQMIENEALKICEMADFNGTIKIIISVPKGEELAKKTFNPRLGIEGGISIIGTSGIVEPMSTRAIIDTIKVELNQRKASGFNYVAVSPGNYGLDFMKKTYSYDLDKSVKCSNFIGDTIDMAKGLGFKKLLLTGHIGKLIKVSGGIMNTHSKEGDCRMELLAAAAIRAGASIETVKKILDCVVTEEGIKQLKVDGILEATMNLVMEKIMYYLTKRAGEDMQVECVMYANDFGELAKSKGAKEWLILLAQEQAQ